MEKYIPKDALVTEIKSRISDIEISQKAGLIKKRDADKKILLFKSVLSLIDALEVKEVDLEKEYEEYVIDDPIFGNFITNNTMGMKLAKHFFELGLKAQKGE